MIPQLSQGGGVAFTGENGRHHPRARFPHEVTEHVVHMKIHLIEGLVHELHLPGGFAHQRVALAPERAHHPNRHRRVKRRVQKTHGMELLRPLGVSDVGLATGHVLEMPGVDQTDINPGVLEHRV